MLTVIFFQKSSQPFIDRYKTLFQPYIDERKIDFCFWDEDGTEPKDTIKELTGIVHGVKEWRALIALPPNEDLSKSEKQYLKTREDNPFDFLCNCDPEPMIKESEVPLIRLSQMLGGVPLINRHFSTDENGNTQVVESRETLEEYQDVWNELDNKYSLPYDMPETLFLFSARHPKRIIIPELTDIEILNRHEIDSSMFWYRNRYPAKARFLVQDCAIPGNAHHAEDLFCFWMTALTIALNPIPSGMFEAYKIYHAKAVVSRDEIHQVFSDYYHRLSNIRFAAEKQVIELRKLAQMNRKQDSLPEYQHEIRVWTNDMISRELFISSKSIGLAGDCPEREEPWWYRRVSDSMKALSSLVRRSTNPRSSNWMNINTMR